MTEAPRLQTERLNLRAHRLDDFAESAAMWADPAVVRHISGVPSTEEAAWTRFLRYRGHWAHLGFGYWLVETRAEGAFVGEVGLAEYRRAIEPPLAAPEAGWVLRTAAHGQGFATEAMRAVFAWADAQLSAEQTVAIFDPAHTASIHVATKLGFAAGPTRLYNARETLVMTRLRGAAPNPPANFSV
ncbi:MAG: GNAT family N-acetyltransferase [Pseudomonadota bacterium]